MVKVKSAAVSQKNYEDASAYVGTRYTDGIATAEWQRAAIDGQGLYVARMTDPSVLARRASKIGKVSDGEFKDAAIKKGGPIIGSRMRDAAPKQAREWAPFRSALEGLSLPPRSPDPMANVDARLKPVVRTLVDTKRTTG